MHIKNVHIKKYKALEDVDITFQTPEKDKNVMNVVAGVNGSGKSTLLEFILMFLGGKAQIIQNGAQKQTNINIDFDAGSLTLSSFGTINKENFINYWSSLEQGSFNKFKVINYETSTMRRGITRTLDPITVFENLKIVNLDSEIILGISEEFIKKHIINEQMKSSIANPSKRMAQVVQDFNSFFGDVELLSKLETIDTHQKPLFRTVTNELISIEHLSSGEKQLYAKVILLRMLEPEDSIILIDEPDIALHPKWQAEIIKLYKKIGKNNQFIITTHSPFIIAQTDYKDLSFLDYSNGKIGLRQLREPLVDIDINTILKTAMGAEYIPIHQQKLHQEYSSLVKAGKEDTNEAEQIKTKILKYESLNSSFFQNLLFDMELN